MKYIVEYICDHFVYSFLFYDRCYVQEQEEKLVALSDDESEDQFEDDVWRHQSRNSKETFVYVDLVSELLLSPFQLFIINIIFHKSS